MNAHTKKGDERRKQTYKKKGGTCAIPPSTISRFYWEEVVAQTAGNLSDASQEKSLSRE
jgi:hypothetical protein